MLRILSLVALLLLVPIGAQAAHYLDPEPTLHPIGSIEAMTTGDVNGDGVDEVIVGTTDVDLALWVLSRSAEGSARARRLPFPSPSFPKFLKAADFDGNGTEEIVLVDTARRVFRVSAGPTPRVVTSRIAGAQATNADIADFDSDGHLDLLLADPSAGGWMLFGDGRGGFARRTAIGLRAFNVAHTAVGDVNGDGATDYILASDAAYVYLNKGNGTFSVPVVIQPDFDRGITSASVGDFNNDGLDDLVLANGGNSPTMIRTYWQSNGKLVHVGATPTHDLPEHTAVGDLDGDGGDDLALVHVGWGRIGLYMSISSASLPSEHLHTLPFVSWGDDVQISDVTGDGCKDLVASRGHEVAVFRGHDCQLTADLRLTGSLSGSGITISTDNLGADGQILNVVVDMTLSSRSGLLTGLSLPSGCRYVETLLRTSRIRCEVDSIAASRGIAWFIPYTVEAEAPRNRITLSAIALGSTQERTLENNRLWRVWSDVAGAPATVRHSRSP